MIVIPAVDLRDGACVQLVGGSYADERVRLPDPLAVASRWYAAGFQHLHVIDLDAATGVGSNSRIVADILDEADADVRVGGGVRSAEQVDELLAAGARAVIVGTRAVEDPGWIGDVARARPGAIIVAADVRDRQVVTRGWQATQRLTVFDLLSDLESLPLAGLLVTAVHRDGRLAGPDLALMADLVEATDLPVIASGGVAGINDLRVLEDRGVAAVVIGMALYAGVLDPEAVAREFAE